MTLAAELQTIRERVEAATKGPWGVHDESAGDSVFLAIEPAGSFDWIADFDLNEEADAQFIAHARTDLPRLLDAVEAVLKYAELAQADYLDDWERGYRTAMDDVTRAISTALEGK